jgi:hypothetical protein
MLAILLGAGTVLLAQAGGYRSLDVLDIVFFGHREHLAAGEECTTCHGSVETRDVLQKEVSTNMTACLECHRERGAPVHCALCHVLGH